MTLSGMKMLKSAVENAISPRKDRPRPLYSLFPEYKTFPVVIMCGLLRNRIARFSVTLPYTGRMRADES